MANVDLEYKQLTAKIMPLVSDFIIIPLMGKMLPPDFKCPIKVQYDTRFVASLKSMNRANYYSTSSFSTLQQKICIILHWKNNLLQIKICL